MVALSGNGTLTPSCREDVHRGRSDGDMTPMQQRHVTGEVRSW